MNLQSIPRRAVVLVATLVAMLTTACAGGSDAIEVPFADRETTTTSSTAPSTIASSTTTADPATSPPTTVEPAPVTAPAPTTTAAPAPVTTAERTLVLWRQGDESPRIALFQAKLIELDYLAAGSDTGVFDGATNSAVLRFQGDYGLVVDGIVGPQTERAIGAAAQSVAAGG